MIDPSRLKENAARMFSRFAVEAPAKTVLFEQLTLEQRGTLPENACRFRGAELPILAFVNGPEDPKWALITTHRILWGEPPREGTVEFQNVDRLLSPALDGGTDGGVDDRLIVYDKDDNRYVVELESGFSFGGFWNVALSLKRAWGQEK